MGICCDGSFIYVCDMGNHRIVKIDAGLVGIGGGTFTAFGTFGTGNGQFNLPYDIAMNSTHLFVVDKANHRIQKITQALAYVSKIGSQGNGDDQFEFPSGIACSVAGDYLIIADSGNYRIQKRTSADALVYDSKIGTQGKDTDKFCGPVGVAIDENDTYIYITDFGYDPGDSVATLYGRIMARAYSDLSAATIFPGSATEWGGRAGNGNNQIDQPHNVDVDRYHGGLYMLIADRWNNRIMRKSLGTEYLWALAGETMENQFRLKEFWDAGDHVTVAVMPLSPNGQRKAPENGATDSHIVQGTAHIPADVPALYGTQQGGGAIELYWPDTTDYYTKAYEIRRGTDWESGVVIGTGITVLRYRAYSPLNITVKYWIKGMNALGYYSATAKSLTHNSGWNGSQLTNVSGGSVAYTANIKTG